MFRRIQGNDEVKAIQKQQFIKLNLDYLEFLKCQVDVFLGGTLSTLYSSMEANFGSSDVKEHFYTFLTSRDSCHNYQNPFTSDLKL